MILLELEQNTTAWTELRRSKIGASDCPIIMDASPYKGPHALWRQKVFNEIGYVSDAMRAGTDREPELLLEHNERFSADFAPRVGESSDHDYMIASFDGYSESKDYTLEIKTCSALKYAEYTKKFPIFWNWQAQHQMSVSGMDSVLFHIFNRGDISQSELVTIKRDESMIASLLEKEKVFYSCMQSFEEPERGEREPEYVERKDSEWEIVAQERFEIDEIKKGIVRRETENKEKILKLSEGKPSKGFGITVSVQKGRTTVDYKSIPQMQDVDISSYTFRGDPTWKISFSRRSFLT